MLRKAVFLDRDGVINRDSPDYIKRLEEFEFLPGSLDALRRLAGSWTSSSARTCLPTAAPAANPSRGCCTPPSGNTGSTFRRPP